MAQKSFREYQISGHRSEASTSFLEVERNVISCQLTGTEISTSTVILIRASSSLVSMADPAKALTSAILFLSASQWSCCLLHTASDLCTPFSTSCQFSMTFSIFHIKSNWSSHHTDFFYISKFDKSRQLTSYTFW